MRQNQLAKDLVWGVAISAAQTESGSSADPKGKSIWDEFCSKNTAWFGHQSPIKNNDHIAESADFFTHYEADIDLIKKLGFTEFRFSIAWARVMPDGKQIDPEGIAFYQKVVAYCLSKQITPWITLYHWDLPAALQTYGGWSNRQIIADFLNYVKYVVRALPEVKHWIILNEPSVFLGAGYLLGIHAPGVKNFRKMLAGTHHAMLCIAEAYKLIKHIQPNSKVGSSFSFTHIESYSHHPKDIKAAKLADCLINRLFIEPLLGLSYPFDEYKALKAIRSFIQPGDLETLATPLDFIGIQTYTREVFKHNPFNFILPIKHIPAHERSLDLSATNWEMYPESLYQCIMKVHAYGLGAALYITENGVAFKDEPIFERVHDYPRIHYYKMHINEVLRAKQNGANVKGYFAWSLLDNFEWAEGYEPRFGLVYVDFKTKQRLLKDSAYWFQKWLKSLRPMLDSI